jgi:hypothetical protein
VPFDPDDAGIMAGEVPDEILPEVVRDDDIGQREQLTGTDCHQPRIARPGPDEGDPPWRGQRPTDGHPDRGRRGQRQRHRRALTR